jgi:V/A-type H+/Na+-transporting ATPase subunit I
MMRPLPTRWFEILAARDDAFMALEALAAAGCVEIEWHPATAAADPLRSAELLKDFAELARKYRPYWPAAATRLSAERRAPLDTMQAALQTLAQWSTAAETPIGELQRAEAQLRELRLTEDALRAMTEARIDFSQLAQASHGVIASVFALPPRAVLATPQDVLTREALLPSERLVLAIGPTASIEAMARAATEVNGRRARFPDWLQPTADANLALVAQRITQLDAVISERRARIAQLAAQHGVARALGEIARATWCVEHGGAIGDGDVFARITGWTDNQPALVAAIEKSGARAIVRWPPSADWPRGAHPPLTLRNPWWVRPFEVFPRLVGMPGAAAADPSTLLAFAVPLMFGYMFGDIGQGAVLVLAGYLLRHRLPVLRLLMPGGLAAMVFGFVFGSVFCIEGWIHPLWVAPMDHPLPILLAPLVGGALLLMLGLAIGALEAWWQGLGMHWLREDGALFTTYLGVLLGFVHPAGWALAALGVLWTVAGATHTVRGMFAALGELIEKTLQILINTLSFARVGAFALAHAGLASAVIALATASDNLVVRALVFALGNVLILVLEGLVVSIQTTRLVLFEFFTRFFQAQGREFRPLAPPPVTVEHPQGLARPSPPPEGVKELGSGPSFP